ncbi:MAG TPA: hypothetical protein VK152_03100 [Paludibacter sp.]|nr:hypothetical protein [Paludibacter sp.]
MNRIKTLFLSLLLGAGLFAQDFEVSPVLMSFNADPGEIQKKQLTIINHSGKPQTYNLKLSDYTIDSQGKKKSAAAGTTKRSCTDWITLNPSFIQLNPNQTASIEVLMTVPKDGFTAKWCMMHVEAAKEQTPFDADKSLATGVMIVPRIVVLVKQSPRSNVSYKATISNLKETTKPADTQRNFEVTVTNVGENVIDANVNLALANMETATEEKFNPVKVTVYPDNSRKVNLQLPKNLKKGKYALAAILDYGHRQPLGGTQMLLEVK